MNTLCSDYNDRSMTPCDADAAANIAAAAPATEIAAEAFSRAPAALAILSVLAISSENSLCACSFSSSVISSFPSSCSIESGQW